MANKNQEFQENKNIIVFAKPVQFEGKEYNEIDLKLEDLTGNDIELAELQFISQNPQIAAQTPLKEMSKGFQAIIASKAAKVPVEFFKQLRAAEYAKVTMRVQAFLLSGE